MIVLLFIGLLVLSLTGNRNNHIVFWISLSLMFDPGGFMAGYFNSVFFGPLKYYDAFFILLNLNFFIAKDIHLSELSKDKPFLRFVIYLFFLELYYVIVYGWLTPSYYGINEDNNFSLFVLKERTTVYGFFIAIYIYLFTKRGLNTHYKIVVFTAVICLALFFVGFVLNENIVPFVTLDRYKGEDIQRVGILSYGLFQIILTIALAVYFLRRRSKVNSPYEALIYIGGSLLFIIYILSLTRRTLIELAVLPIIALWIISLITHSPPRVGKLTFAIVILVTLLGLIAPRYFTWAGRLYKDISYLIITGKDTRGQSEYRMSGTGDLIYVKESIKQKPLLGTGFTWMLYEEKDRRVQGGDKFAAAWDAAQEVPIYFAFFSRGIIGFIIYVPVYIFIIKTLFLLYRNLKTSYRFNISGFSKQQSIIFILGIVIVIEFVLMFTARVFTLFGGLSSPIFMTYVGLLFGIGYLFKNKFYAQKESISIGPTYR